MLDENEIREIQQAAYELVQRKDYDNAGPLLMRLLEENPNDASALNFLGVMHLDMQNYQFAYQFLRRALQEKPNVAAMWTNFGLAAHELGRNKEAMSCYLKSAEIDNEYFKAYDNAAALLIGEAKWNDAEQMCMASLDISPEGKLANKNLAHVYLARHEWAKGWQHWDLSLGEKFRKEWTYGDEPRWDGSKGQAVVVFGEQGLGDEIMFASCIPDAIKDCKKVIIDCDPKLEKLFKRSFPRADVHGTRREEAPRWLETARIDARCAISSLPKFYRNKDADFPGTPYLKADPELRQMWRAIFDSYGKPVYGLTLVGGTKLTNQSGRTVTPEQFSPLFARDAVFVSLEYKGEPLNHPKIKEFPWATRSSDYDMTAALIAELDAVIGINTTAHLCADALGVPTHTLIPAHHDWRHEGENLWSKTNKSYLQAEGETWRDVIRRIQL